MKYPRKILPAMFIIILVLSGADSVNSDTTYKKLLRESIFETGPAQAPYYFTLALSSSYTIDFSLTMTQGHFSRNGSWYSKVKSKSPSIGYFWALNCGDLVFINRRDDIVYVLNPKTGRYNKLAPIYEAYYKLNYLWVGPRDEIFVELSARNESETKQKYPNPFSRRTATRNYKLFRLLRNDNVYRLDESFDSPVYNISSNRIRISPNNEIYVHQRGGSAIVLNQNGRQLGISRAEGRAKDLSEFTIKRGRDKLIEVIDVNSGRVMLCDEFSRQIGNHNFKSTFDNNLICYFHSRYSFSTPDSGEIGADIPYVMGKDLNTHERYSVDLIECARPDYRYFNVADISINYLGEIYAIVVYFNDIGQITGDEKIVLYRWRRA
ncbi:MAG: hypothetical protein GY839_14105 [candidate division Zixibacteria bacterium]|nr:hypothetical protein [candidate division Zixibacteria bacterium]